MPYLKNYQKTLLAKSKMSDERLSYGEPVFYLCNTHK